jgi:hypothetical protein
LLVLQGRGLLLASSIGYSSLHFSAAAGLSLHNNKTKPFVTVSCALYAHRSAVSQLPLRCSCPTRPTESYTSYTKDVDDYYYSYCYCTSSILYVNKSSDFKSRPLGSRHPSKASPNAATTAPRTVKLRVPERLKSDQPHSLAQAPGGNWRTTLLYYLTLQQPSPSSKSQSLPSHAPSLPRFHLMLRDTINYSRVSSIDTCLDSIPSIIHFAL